MMTIEKMVDNMYCNQFTQPKIMRKMILDYVRVIPNIKFNGKGFICALINSRCHVGCAHCMFASNMAEEKNIFNTMSSMRVRNLMQLVRDANTGYLLVSGGGEPFLEPSLMYQIAKDSTAELTWLVTSGFWAKKKSKAITILETLYQSYLSGSAYMFNKRICVRVSIDTHHVEKLGDILHSPFNYIINIISIFESTYSHQNGFFLQIHCLEGEEDLIEKLRQYISAIVVENIYSTHEIEKITESVIALRMPSGYTFEVTFAKLLLSDIAADLRDAELLEKRIQLFEKDALINEKGAAAYQINSDGSIGTDMLVIYDGRIAGGWQSEMPDVKINVDVDSYKIIVNKTLSDPGVLATIERGLDYRFEIIDEVCQKACIRAKAVNIRDYTSPVLLEEDTIKLYYTIRAIQDFISEDRIESGNIDNWPPELKTFVAESKERLQFLYRTSDYDIVKQFEEAEPGFPAFIQGIRTLAKNGNNSEFIRIFSEQHDVDFRRISKWNLLIKRIIHKWYDIKSLNEEELNILEDVERLVTSRLPKGYMFYEGLSRMN